MSTRAARLCLAVVMGASLITVAGPAAAPATAGVDAIPDLAVAPLRDFQIQNVGGQRLLRFTSSMVNVGAGQFEVHGHRDNASQPMQIEQWMYTDPNRSTVSSILATPAGAHFAGDGHNHWHVQEMMRYDLWNGNVTAPGAKVGFCFLDLEPYNTSLPGASGSPFYTSCGNTSNATGFVMGISIGWADTYHASLPFQWVDIAGLPSGTYTVRARVDPNGFFVESNEINQCAYATVSISGSSVQVLGSGGDCVNDWSGSPFADDIAWAFGAGITTGCAPELFCPARNVSREEMASFIARARGLTSSGTDWFTDDETSIHEPAINAIRDAGITLGCGPNLFCPTSLVTREQMASFVVRALGLKAVGTDYFTDDEGSIHEGDINTFRAAEITLGCGPSIFCPTGLVTREQMAAFLHRALD